MRLLLPYLLLLVLLFFVACSVARRSRRSRRNVLLAGWAAVAAMAGGTFYFILFAGSEPIGTAIVGLAATVMLGYAVRGVQRRTRTAHLPDPPLGRRRTRAGATR